MCRILVIISTSEQQRVGCIVLIRVFQMVPVDQLESIADIYHNLRPKPHDLAEQLG